MTDTMPIRVTVGESWDQVRLDAAADAPLGEIKERALRAAGVRGAPENFVLKFRGAEVWEGGTTVRDLGLVPNASLVILRRRRRPVR